MKDGITETYKIPHMNVKIWM